MPYPNQPRLDFEEQVCRALIARGHKASYEYPGYIQLVNPDGTHWNIGTTNAKWDGDLLDINDEQVLSGFATDLGADCTDVQQIVIAIEDAINKYTINAVACFGTLLAACQQAYDQLGKDGTWNVSTLRLDVIRPALKQAGVKV